MQNRVDIKDFILKIEQDFSVNNWLVNNHHLWPYIRIKLFFYLINIVEAKPVLVKKTVKTQSKKTLLKKLKKTVKSSLHRVNSLVYYIKWYYALKQKNYLFFGAAAHRVNYKNSRYNKYIDVLIEKNNWKNDSLIFEYGDVEIKKQYNLNVIKTFNRALQGYMVFNKPKTKQNNINLEGYNVFLEHLKTVKGLESFIYNFSEDEIISWTNTNFLIKKAFFKKVLKRINPKKVMMLCYYSNDLMPMLAACSDLGIKETIELQHGPQTDIQLCYGNWSVVPNTGYSTIPKKYWCWDKYSAKAINNWAENNSIYETNITGNPWVDYWKQKKEVYKHNGYILYSLQPEPITHNQSFTSQIIETISKSEVKWFIRLHPRQMHELENIRTILKENDILDKVNIDDATNDPLPQLLLNASLHITHSSGTALEASYFGLKTVLINHIGLKSFPHLLNTNSATYIDFMDSQFANKLNSIIKTVS